MLEPVRLGGALALGAVSFRYPGQDEGTKVLSDVSLQVRPGEFVAIVGPSGSGKSTIMRLLLGFETADAGTVTYDGRELSTLDLREVRRPRILMFDEATSALDNLTQAIVTESLFQKGGLERRKGMNPKPYPSDLTSQQWAVLKPLLPPARTGGRPRKTEMRSVVNAIFYRNRNGCIWRALPHDFPPWRTVYNYFAAWKRDGTWKAINDALRRRVRRRAGRPPTPMPAVSIARPSRRPKGVASMVTTVPSGSPVGR